MIVPLVAPLDASMVVPVARPMEIQLVESDHP